MLMFQDLFIFIKSYVYIFIIFNNVQLSCASSDLARTAQSQISALNSLCKCEILVLFHNNNVIGWIDHGLSDDILPRRYLLLCESGTVTVQL